jgi:hypothetical protein
MKAARWIRCVLPAVIVAATGCPEPEAVRVHEEPAPKPAAAPVVPAEQKKFRTLAAMVPSGGVVKDDDPRWWFLKMSGSAAFVGKYEADFDKLLATVHTTTNEMDPITWELPGGWKREEGGAMGMRFATLKAPGGDAEVAVSQAGGLVLTNAQRWWGQLWGDDKQSEITPLNLDSYIRQQKTVKGRLIFRVDMFGPNDPNAKRPMKNPHGGQ